MGNQLSSSAPSATQADLPTLLNDLPSFTALGTLGGSKILKTALCDHGNGEGRVVVKVYPKRSLSSLSSSAGQSNVDELKPYERRLEDVRDKLNFGFAPNLLPFARWIETDRAAFLFRQYMAYNVYDRFHTHPFLTGVEKQWLAYQLLEALRQLHSVGLRHGDIKTENLVCTTWNWLLLTDIPFFKPTRLPANNPADYSFYFETARRRCYIAPERFYTASDRHQSAQPSHGLPSSSSFAQFPAAQSDSSSLTEAMDVFSAGCAIAEIFLEGEPLFDLPQLLSYKEGGYDPTTVLQTKIADTEVRELIQAMIHREPSERPSAKQLMDEFRDRVFPSSFAFLHTLMSKLLAPDQFTNPDQKISFIKTNQRKIIREIAGSDGHDDSRANNVQAKHSTVTTSLASPSHSHSFHSLSALRSPDAGIDAEPISVTVTKTSGLGASLAAAQSQSSTPSHPMLAELTAFAAQLEASAGTGDEPNNPLKDWSAIESKAKTYQRPAFASLASLPAPALRLASPSNTPTPLSSSHSPSSSPSWMPASAPQSARQFAPDSPSIGSVLPNASPPLEELSPPASVTVTPASNVLTMVATLVCSCIQNTQSPKSKLVALDLLAAFALYVDDEVRLGRLVPYAIALLTDAAPLVRSRAVCVLTRIVRLVSSFPASDAHVFPEYIFPALSRLPHDTDELVRMSYAANIATLAETARRFLDIAQQNQNNSQRSTNADITGIGPASSSTSSSYDAELSSLQDVLLKLLIEMLTAGGSSVKRALLLDITRLCLFMGRKRVNNELLPHLITVLNDRDWQLRVAFFDNIVGVSVFVGRVAFANFVLPCIEQSLFDVEETVIQRAVTALTQLVQLGLFEKRIMIEIADKVAPLLAHPSAWIRQETISLTIAMSKALGLAKTYCCLLPALKPFLTQSLAQLSRAALMASLKKPLTRADFDSVVFPSHRLHADEEILGSDGASELDNQRGRSSSTSSTASLASSTTSSASVSSGWQQDAELRPMMQRYLQKVSMALATKSFNASNAGDTEVSDTHDLESYASIDAVAPVYQIEIERTAADSHTHVAASPADRVQQDLLDSLGIVGQPNKSRSQAHTLAQSQSSVKRRDPIRQPLNKVQPYILRALQVPPQAPNLGQLRESTLSHAPFYGHYHALEVGYHDSHDPKQWRPRGVLVATLTEHTARVNSISVSRDSVFLASGSADGSVKIWDCARLKLTANARSQLTWQHTGPVTALTVCDSSHSVASACSSGLLAVMKVEYAANLEDGAHKYGGLSEVKKIDCAKEGQVVAVEHFNTLTESLLVYATQSGSVHSWDLRSRAQPFSLRVADALGLVSAVAIGPTPYCLTAGTSRGFIVVWDLRFHLPVHVWRHHAKSRIVSLTPIDVLTVMPHARSTQPQLQSQAQAQYPTKGPLLFVAAEGCNQIAAFDLVTGECRLVARVQEQPEPASNSQAALTQAASSTAAAAATFTHATGQLRAQQSVSPLSLPFLRDALTKDFPSNLMDEAFLRELEAMATMAATPAPAMPLTAPASAPARPWHMTSVLVCPSSFLLTAGMDRVVRYWDLKEPIDSYRIAAPDTDATLAADESAVRFLGRAENSTIVLEECRAAPSNTVAQTGDAELTEKLRSALARRSRGAQPPCPAHASGIVAMKAIEHPQKMIATAATDGTIKIWI